MRKKLVLFVVVALAALSVGALALLIVAFMVLEGRLVALVEEEVARDLDATVTIGDAGIAFPLPLVGVRVDDVKVSGVGAFEGVDLAVIDRVQVAVDPFSAVGSGPVRVERVSLDAPRFHVVIDEEGRANYDIFGDSDDEGGEYHLRLERFAIAGGEVVYEQRESGMRAELLGIDHDSRGDLSDVVAQLDTQTEVASVSVWLADLAALSEGRLVADMDVTYDMDSGKVTLDGAQITLNALTVGLDGTVLPTDAGFDVDLGYEAVDTAFKSVLSLVPTAYTADYADVAADGTFSLSGSAKGLYASEEDHLPAFDLAVTVADGRVQYPDLPSSVEQIAAEIAITHPEGPTDLAEIDVKRFRMAVGGNPVEGTVRVRHPMTDPDVAASVHGALDLTALAQAWPMEDMEVGGRLDVDVEVAGRMSDFEARAADRVEASGSVKSTDLSYASPDLPVPVRVHALAMDLSPQRAVVHDLKTTFGKSDVAGSGHVDNVLPYLLQGATLSGTFDITGDLVDLEPFEGEEDTEEAGGVVAVPANLDLTVNTRLGRVIANGVQFDDVRGTVRVRDGKVIMDGLHLVVLGGSATLNGTYAAPDASAADLDLKIDGVRLDVQRTTETFTSLQRIAPVLKGATGRFDPGIQLAARLNSDGTPDLTGLFSEGDVHAYDVALTPAALAQVAEKLLDPKYKRMGLHGATLAYEMADGRLRVEPTSVSLGGVPATLHGGAGVLDQTLDMKVDLTLPTSGLQGASFLSGPTALGDAVDLRVTFSGPWDKPRVGVALADGLASQGRAAVEQAVGVDLAAEARERGDQLVEEARAQADELRAEAADAAEQIRAEAKAAGEKLVDEASGPVAKAAAKEAARRLEAEADKRASEVEGEADKAGKALVRKARKERDRLVEEASN